MGVSPMEFLLTPGWVSNTDHLNSLTKQVVNYQVFEMIVLALLTGVWTVQSEVQAYGLSMVKGRESSWDLWPCWYIQISVGAVLWLACTAVGLESFDHSQYLYLPKSRELLP